MSSFKAIFEVLIMCFLWLFFSDKSRKHCCEILNIKGKLKFSNGCRIHNIFSPYHLDMGLSLKQDNVWRLKTILTLQLLKWLHSFLSKLNHQFDKYFQKPIIYKNVLYMDLYYIVTIFLFKRLWIANILRIRKKWLQKLSVQVFKNV